MTHEPPATLRSQDMVFTLWGDYLLEREEPVWVGSLITLLGTLGVSAMAVRTVLSRMARKQWLTVEHRGTRSWYGLSRRGHKLLTEGRERIYHPPRPEPWDGSWYLVTYTIPESRRALRDQLRVKLLWLGCGPLLNGVWMTPHDVRREVQEIAAALRITKHVEVFRAEHTGFSDLGALVGQCWDLRAIQARYAAFIARWHADFTGCHDCVMAGGKVPVPHACAEPSECFRRRFLLVHEWRTFPLEDPFLPQRLLPADWHGHEALRLFERYHDVLAGPAERYVREVVEAGDRLETARSPVRLAAQL